MPRGPIVIAKSDLSAARLLTSTASREWSAPPLPDDRPPTLREARARAAAAATWMARDPDARRRVDAVYTDVDEALCVWMRAPSTARPVIASQLRTMAQEWGADAAVLAVEPLREEAGAARTRRGSRRRKGAEEPATPAQDAPLEAPGFGVLALPDAMIRLMVDAADAAGTRIGVVGTLWHLLADAAGSRDADDLCGVVMLDPAANRAVWAWADGHGLVAAGSARMEALAAEAAVQRIALDWLTWAAQLGRAPTRVTVIGPDSKGWSAALGRAWNEVPTNAIETDDPVRAAADLAGEAPVSTARSGRRSLTRITHRPTRATRTRYQIAGAALVLLLAATSSVAFRLWQKAAEWRGEAESTRQVMIQTIRDTWPEKSKLKSMASPATVAKELVAEEFRDFKPYEAPPRPRPILEEALRIAGILASRDEDRADNLPVVQLSQLILDQERGNTLSFQVEDRQLATELILALSENSAWVKWERAANNPNVLAPNLAGTWLKETE